MASQIDIINSALVHIGAKLIQDIDQQDEEARVMKDIWSMCRRQVLSESNWKFAKTRVTLSPDATAPAFTWTYQFQIPSDLLRIIDLASRGGTLAPKNYERNKDKILCNYDEIDLRYICDITETGRFPEYFSGALSMWLAYKACYTLTGDKTFQDRLYREYRATLASAKFHDSSQERGQQLVADDWINSRYGNTE